MKLIFRKKDGTLIGNVTGAIAKEMSAMLLDHALFTADTHHWSKNDMVFVCQDAVKIGFSKLFNIDGGFHISLFVEDYVVVEK